MKIGVLAPIIKGPIKIFHADISTSKIEYFILSIKSVASRFTSSDVFVSKVEFQTLYIRTEILIDSTN